MLLTSSQVGVAISSTIVFLFTSALFMSGYVLQQKTVSNIRQAIKPRAAPIHTYMTLLDNEGERTNPTEATIIHVEDSIEGVNTSGSEPENVQNAQTEEPSRSKWELKDDGPPVPWPNRIASVHDESDEYHNVSEDGEQPETEQEKLSTFVDQDISQPGRLNFIMKEWRKRKSKNDLDIKDVTPLDSLSRAARRKRIKADIAKLGPADDPDGSRYLPRKLW